ncbi:hypothetical protein FOMPIDRAFT_1101618, partial [Fomitopsis schrenkii]
RTKAHMKIATLNICGRGDLSAGPRQNKWNALHQAAKEQKLGIIAIQEAHLGDAHVQRIHAMYGRRLHIIHSESERENDAEGVAFVLNREQVDISQVEKHAIIPGRALYMKTKWHGGRTLTLLNVYAPNQSTANAKFWEDIQIELRNHRLTRPDVLLGDFNIVEEPGDRLPMRDDANPPVQALKTLLRWLELTDGWRMSEPTTKDYTYPQRGATSRSRIDRIYVTQDLLQASTDWDINTTAIPTDHRLVTARISTENAPFIGKGRWVMPAHIMLDQQYIEEIIKLGKEAIEEAQRTLNLTRTRERNPQKVLKQFKTEAAQRAKERLKRRVPVLKAAIKTLKDTLMGIQGDPSFAEDANLQEEAAKVQDDIVALERRRHGQAQALTNSKYALNREVPSKYWSAVN